jgi:subtilase family serine protease
MGKGLTVSRRPLPDLAVSSMTLLLNGEELDLQEGTNSGAHVEVNVSVVNRGNEETKSETTVELYLGNPLLSGKLLGSFKVPEGLNPDEVYTDSMEWIAEKPKQKSNVPILFVVVDAREVEQEVDEFNNYDLRPLKVGAALPDLTVLALDITDPAGAPVGSITYGTTLTVEATVTNGGTDVSFQVALLHLYLDQVDEGNLIADIATSTLGIGERVSRSTTWTPTPGNVDGGPHTIIAVVDPINEIEESSDANNQLSAEFSIDGDAMPNLLMMDLWVTQGERTVERLDEDDTATIHVRIVNLGQAPLFTPAVVEMFHGDPVQGGVPVGNWQISELDVGANISFEAEWTFKNDDPMMVYIDRVNAVEETNENDNTGTKQIDVEPPPEGANYAVIGAAMGVAVLILVLMVLLIGRRPTTPPVDEMPPGGPLVIPPEGSEALTGEVAEEEAGEGPPEGPVGDAGEEPPEVPEEETGEEPAPEEPAEADEAAPEVTTCPSCGEEVDPEWILCPFCDGKLR